MVTVGLFAARDVPDMLPTTGQACINSYREASEMQELADYFESQAEWRDRKADEHPEDARNRRAAAGLRDAAEYVRSLPRDDRRLATLRELDLDAGTGVVSPGEEPSRLAGRYRFDNPEQSPDEFLTAFTAACVEAAEQDDSG